MKPLKGKLFDLNLAKAEQPKPTVKRVEIITSLERMLITQALNEALASGPLSQMIMLELLYAESD